jgi:CubicO group peptidase (beta-lactamase class C family)
VAGDPAVGHGSSIAAVRALSQIEAWPGAAAAAVVVGPDGTIATHGDVERVHPWASVTKLLTALAALVAVEEGTIDLDESAGPEGSTVRHLLAHASGLAPDDDAVLAEPGRRRIYSNTGFERLGDLVAARAEMPFAGYLSGAVLGPLGIAGELQGSPAHAFAGSLSDLALLGHELLAPSVVAPETLAEATSVQFPGLVGVLPGFGRMEPNDWGLGLELRDAKSPHWTGSRNSPRTYGHFGGSGTFLWVDPDADLACVALSDREFDEWALEAWPRLSDAVLSAS